MSIPVPVEELGDAVERYGATAFLLTTSDDQRPHATHVTVSVDGAVLSCGLGRKGARNGMARPNVTLLWSPVESGGYSLIVDGTMAVSGTPGEDATAAISATNGVLHRPAATGSQPSATGCEADCAPVEVGE